ncbi:MAG TPA: hypothetical protein VLV18_06465 [Terriglobales bacterium]|nr:hypothetical protein [Terriglobales bacterium]
MAAPAPALNATLNPRRIPNSIIRIAIGPTGMAIPYPAKTPRRNGSITEMLPHSTRQIAH